MAREIVFVCIIIRGLFHFIVTLSRELRINISILFFNLIDSIESLEQFGRGIADNDIDLAEFYRKFFQRNALPIITFMFEKNIGRIWPPPFVVGNASGWIGSNVRSVVNSIQN